MVYHLFCQPKCKYRNFARKLFQAIFIFCILNWDKNIKENVCRYHFHAVIMHRILTPPLVFYFNISHFRVIVWTLKLRLTLKRNRQLGSKVKVTINRIEWQMQVFGQTTLIRGIILFYQVCDTDEKMSMISNALAKILTYDRHGKTPQMSAIISIQLVNYQNRKWWAI